MNLVGIATVLAKRKKTMLKWIRGSALTLAVLIGTGVLPSGYAFAQAKTASEILGVWEAVDGSVKLEMFEAADSYAARILYGRLLMEADGATFKKDSLNPDPSLRSRSLEGIVFLDGLKWDAGDKRWEDGRFYSGATGRTHSARATMVDETMELRAYMGTPALGRTMVLRRAQ
jgi:uncharacterized protein (DUF2147 family)